VIFGAIIAVTLHFINERFTPVVRLSYKSTATGSWVSELKSTMKRNGLQGNGNLLIDILDLKFI